MIISKHKYINIIINYFIILVCLIIFVITIINILNKK